MSVCTPSKFVRGLPVYWREQAKPKLTQMSIFIMQVMLIVFSIAQGFYLVGWVVLTAVGPFEPFLLSPNDAPAVEVHLADLPLLVTSVPNFATAVVVIFAGLLIVTGALALGTWVRSVCMAGESGGQ